MYFILSTAAGLNIVSLKPWVKNNNLITERIEYRNTEEEEYKHLKVQKRGRTTCKTTELSHSPGPDQSSPAWYREVLGVLGDPGWSRSIPGPAEKPESPLSASYQPVCPLVSERTETLNLRKSAIPLPHSFFHPPLISSKWGAGHRPVLYVCCGPRMYSLPQPSKKQTSKRAKFCLSVSLFVLRLAWADDCLNIGLQSFGNINKSIHVMIWETNE